MSDLENDGKVHTFWHPLKIRGEVGEISIPKYIWWPSTAWMLNTMDW